MDIQDVERAKGKKGFAKVQGCCQQAKTEGFEWVWIDSCCINKDSHTELSEAINSMYKWYRQATVCYAYLEDIPKHKSSVRISSSRRSSRYLEKGYLGITKSRWFSRGWTLQELIAPKIVVFYSGDWTRIGLKSEDWFARHISRVTGISENVLKGTLPISDCNAAEKLSWASSRKTTREEDIAYCLLGLLGITMPLLYGEGQYAFIRLQEEILKRKADYTILAWRHRPPESPYRGVLADSPARFCRQESCPCQPVFFGECGHDREVGCHCEAGFVQWHYSDLTVHHPSLSSMPLASSHGLHLNLPVARNPPSDWWASSLASLNCRRLPTNEILCLMVDISSDRTAVICNAAPLVFIPPRLKPEFHRMNFVLRETDSCPRIRYPTDRYAIQACLRSHDYKRRSGIPALGALLGIGTRPKLPCSRYPNFRLYKAVVHGEDAPQSPASEPTAERAELVTEPDQLFSPRPSTPQGPSKVERESYDRRRKIRKRTPERSKSIDKALPPLPFLTYSDSEFVPKMERLHLDADDFTEYSEKAAREEFPPRQSKQAFKRALTDITGRINDKPQGIREDRRVEKKRPRDSSPPARSHENCRLLRRRLEGERSERTWSSQATLASYPVNNHDAKSPPKTASKYRGDCESEQKVMDWLSSVQDPWNFLRRGHVRDENRPQKDPPPVDHYSQAKSHVRNGASDDQGSPASGTEWVSCPSCP